MANGYDAFGRGFRNMENERKTLENLRLLILKLDQFIQLHEGTIRDIKEKRGSSRKVVGFEPSERQSEIADEGSIPNFV